MHKPKLALALVAGAAVAMPPAIAAATEHAKPVANGYYAPLELRQTPSPTVEFYVRQHSKVVRLSLLCRPVNSTYAQETYSIGVVAPTLKLNASGGFYYHGPAKVTEEPGNSPTLGETTLTIRARHVNGPLYRYTYEGVRHSLPTAFRGTVSSPACQKLPVGGKLRLFGPVPGE